MAPAQVIRVLVVNPNTSQHMTDALKPVVAHLGYDNVVYSYFTSPYPGVPSINSDIDAAQSAEICLPSLVDLLPEHDVFLIACYSQHPLVPHLQIEIAKRNFDTRKYVTGIFEASATASLLLAGSTTKTAFAIVSTGKIWETLLQQAVDEFLGVKNSSRFLGCETTGLTATELHELPAAKVRMRMKDATKRLFVISKQRGVSVVAICLGCAGMVGLEETVREACVEEVGVEAGGKIAIVDGVKVGVGQLISLFRSGF